MRNVCCVVDSECTHPANALYNSKLKTRCFACGEPVCTKCSSRINYMDYGRRRICNNCKDDWLRQKALNTIIKRTNKLKG